MGKSIVIGCAIMVAANVILSVHGCELCMGESEAVVIDLTTGIRTAVIPERIRYFSQWVDGAVAGSEAVVHGAEALEGEWKAVEVATAAERAAMRFFKVVIEGP